MSGICGIFNLDGKPADADLLARMSTALAHRGRDREGHWLEGAAGLAHRMLWTTPEAVRETQPLCAASGALFLVLDGRVDNRQELRSRLEAQGQQLRDDTDAELILHAYQCWEEAAPERIIGDFAFAIWDRRSRSLFCARDPVGVKPFYYFADGRSFRFASELQALFVDPLIPREPNEGVVGAYLVNAPPSQEETLWQGICSLPPAHCMRVDAGGVRKSRYWNMDLSQEIRFPCEADYNARFKELFLEAVKCRLRGFGRVGAHLSGGLDSSSVVAMAASLIQERQIPDSGFETFSLDFPGRDCDESAFSQAVATQWKLALHAIPPAPQASMPRLEQSRRYCDIPDYPNGAMAASLRTFAQGKGFRVLLTGCGGDEWLSGSIYRFADQLRGLRVRELLAGLRSEAERIGIYAALGRLSTFGVRPLMPSPARAVFRALRSWVGADWRAPSWLKASFVRRIDLPARLRQDLGMHACTSFARRKRWRTLVDGRLSHTLEMEDRASAWHGLDERHPFLDRRLIEFVVALPEKEFWRNGRGKHILRESMAGLLPEAVRQRESKVFFNHLVVEDLLAHSEVLLGPSLLLAERGWVESENLRHHFLQARERWLEGKSLNYRSWDLWMALALELWLRGTVSLPASALSGGADARALAWPLRR